MLGKDKRSSFIFCSISDEDKTFYIVATPGDDVHDGDFANGAVVTEVSGACTDDLSSMVRKCFSS
jgi:hypothetical protein